MYLLPLVSAVVYVLGALLLKRGNENEGVQHLGRAMELDAALVEPGHEYTVRMRAVLDAEKLPGPLRLIAFWRRDWSLGSDWYRWQLQGG